MALELYLGRVPASMYPFEDLAAQQLEFLAKDLDRLRDQIEDARKGASIVSTLESRLMRREFVRCTKQSVSITAVARYKPSDSDINLSFLTIVPFVDLVTYLPLPEIRNFSQNVSAIKRASTIWHGRKLDARWAAYHTCLESVNAEMAAMFQQEIQTHIESSKAPPSHPENLEDISIDPMLQRIEGPPNHAEVERNASQATNLVFSHARNEDETIQNDSSLPEKSQAALNPPLDEGILLRVIKAKSVSWGPDDPTTLDSMVDLAVVYISRAKFPDARDLLVASLRGYGKHRTRDSPEVSRSLKLLAEVEYHLNE